MRGDQERRAVTRRGAVVVSLRRARHCDPVCSFARSLNGREFGVTADARSVPFGSIEGEKATATILTGANLVTEDVHVGREEASDLRDDASRAGLIGGSGERATAWPVVGGRDVGDEEGRTGEVTVQDRPMLCVQDRARIGGTEGERPPGPMPIRVRVVGGIADRFTCGRGSTDAFGSVRSCTA